MNKIEAINAIKGLDVVDKVDLLNDYFDFHDYNEYLYDMDSFNDVFSGVAPVEIVETANRAHHYGDAGARFDTGADYFYENDHGNLVSLDEADVDDFLSDYLDDVAEAVANGELTITGA